ncbi:hypothetical protein [Cyclobacterium plantarum]
MCSQVKYSIYAVLLICFHGYGASDEGRAKLLIRTIGWSAEGWPEVDL